MATPNSDLVYYTDILKLIVGCGFIVGTGLTITDSTNLVTTIQ